MDTKEQFVTAYQTYIKREGADRLLDWLLKSDFFEAPASTKFHSAKAGGLCEHSLNVFFRLKALVEAESKIHPAYTTGITEENIAVASLLHDVCKVDYYKVSYRNSKTDGVWTQVPYYSVDDSLPYGHGEKSVYIIGGFMRLTRDEAMAINWHMGGFDSRVKGGDFSISRAFERHPFATMMHIADIQATYFDELRGEEDAK